MLILHFLLSKVTMISRSMQNFLVEWNECSPLIQMSEYEGKNEHSNGTGSNKPSIEQWEPNIPGQITKVVNILLMTAFNMSVLHCTSSVWTSCSLVLVASYYPGNYFLSLVCWIACLLYVLLTLLWSTSSSNSWDTVHGMSTFWNPTCWKMYSTPICDQSFGWVWNYSL